MLEAPDEAAADGSVQDKVEAIERIDQDMVGPVRRLCSQGVRLLVAPRPWCRLTWRTLYPS